eukprot:jgi/Mesvir1/14351/Mv09758-RA.1
MAAPCPNLGWEALELGRRGGRSVLAVDISVSALEVAKQLREESGVPADVVAFEKVDFFEYDPADKFDFVFDYTFFCAIPPAWRPKWAQGMARMVKRGSGKLATLMFPITPMNGDANSGPPFHSPPQAYQRVLEPLGFRAIYDEPVANSLGPRQQAQDGHMPAASFRHLLLASACTVTGVHMLCIIILSKF